MATRGWEKAKVLAESAGARADEYRSAAARSTKARNGATLPVGTRSKYGAVKTVVDGVTFASKAEARRYAELKCLQRAGKIFRLQLQPVYRLCVWTSKKHGAKESLPALGEYRADFRYCNIPGCLCAWGCTVEDVKGFKTPLYRWKKKHVEAQYGIQIREIK